MMHVTRRFIVTATMLAGAALALLADATLAADAPEWTVDAGKSSIVFTGRQMGVPSSGRFKSFTAKVKFDPADLPASAVEVVVDVASADAGNPDIDKELKQAKWFDAATFPTVRFVTTALRAKTADGAGKGDYEAAARLTIRDVTADVVLPFKLDIAPDSADPSQLVARMIGELTISRTKFGVGRDEWRDTKIVGDEVALKIEVLARRKK